MRSLFCIIFLLSFIGCASNPEKNKDNKFTKPFLDQNLIKGKTPKSKVIELLGSPEMINSDSEGFEQWVYSKHYAQIHDNGVGVGMLGAGFLSNTFLGVDVSGDQSTTTSTKSTVTLTVYFNKKGKVNRYSFGQSRI